MKPTGQFRSILVGPIALAVLVLSPLARAETYESRAVLQIHHAAIEVGPGDLQNVPTLSHKALESELVVITAPKTLNQVVKNLDLTNRWNTDAAAARQRLKEMIKTKIIKGTELIEVSVRSQAGKEAQGICQAVTESYQRLREAEARQRADRALKALEEEVRHQEDLVAEKRRRFQAIVKSVGIPYVEGADPQQMRKAAQIAAHELELERERLRLNVHITVLKNVEGDNRLQYAAGLELPENPVPVAYAVLEEAKRARRSLSDSGIAADHPASRKQTSRVESLTAAAHQMADRLLQSLEAKVQEKEQLHADTQKAVEEARHDAVDRALASQDFVEAREDYESTKAVLKEMKILDSAKRIALKIPKAPVTIHQVPNLPSKPVRD